MAGGYATHPPVTTTENNVVETRRSKGQRMTFFAIIAVIVAVAAVPLAASFGSWVSSNYNASVLQGESAVTNVYSPNGSAIAFSHAAGGYTWTMPTGVTTAYVETNITVSEMQDTSVNQLTWESLFSGSGNLTFGVGTGTSDFLPYGYATASALTSAQIPVAPTYLTGDPSQHAIVEVQSSAATYGNVTIAARGNSGISNWFGPAAAEDIGYIVGAIVVFVCAFLAIPWYDLEMHRITDTVSTRILRRPPRTRSKARGRAD